MKNIYLIGFMGSGKSTIAKELVKILPCRIVDMDSAIEYLMAMPIPEIFEKFGQEGFRDQETMLLKKLSEDQRLIVSCGGGIILRDENIDLMKASGHIIRLNVDARTVMERVGSDENRPLLSGKSLEEIENMIEDRENLYQKAADYTVDTVGKSANEISAEIIKILAMDGKLV